MKVKELIELLRDIDENLDVFIYATSSASNYHSPNEVYYEDGDDVNPPSITIACY